MVHTSSACVAVCVHVITAADGVWVSGHLHEQSRVCNCIYTCALWLYVTMCKDVCKGSGALASFTWAVPLGQGDHGGREERLKGPGPSETAPMSSGFVSQVV